MGIPDATHKLAVDAVAGAISHISVHTGDASTTGANEATGGGYARQATTFATGSMSGGVWVRPGSQVEIPVAAGDYEQIGFWSASSGGTFRGSDNFAGGTITVVGTGISLRVTPYVQI